MDISPNRRNYIRERLQDSFGKIGIPVSQQPSLIDAYFKAVKSRGASQFYEATFDVEKRIDQIARETRQPRARTKEQVLAQPHLLLAQLQKPPVNTSKQGKIIPGDREIADAALAIKQNTGKLPTPMSKHSGLPEGSIGWSILIRLTLPQRGVTVKSMVLEFYPDAFKKPVPFRRVRAVVPDDETIARAAIKIMQSKSRLPNNRDKHDELPPGSAGWATIPAHLRNRGTSIKQLVKIYCLDDYRELGRMKRYSPKDMPVVSARDNADNVIRDVFSRSTRNAETPPCSRDGMAGSKPRVVSTGLKL